MRTGYRTWGRGPLPNHAKRAIIKRAVKEWAILTLIFFFLTSYFLVNGKWFVWHTLFTFLSAMAAEVVLGQVIELEHIRKNERD